MHLLKFPLDSQICPLWIGSYGYASRDLQYRWRENGGVSIDDLSTAQFLITDMPQGVVNDRTNRLTEYGFRNDSVAYLHFYLERQTGFFLLQVSTAQCANCRNYLPFSFYVKSILRDFWVSKTA